MENNGSVEAVSPQDDDSQDNVRGGKATPAKRKANGDGPVRAKRNRYISIACNECKRRKIKCNGETPCHRCSNLSLECIYAPNCCSNGFRESEEYGTMTRQLTSLQEQIDTLASGLESLQRKQVSIQAQPSHIIPNAPPSGFVSESPNPAQRSRRPQQSITGGTTFDYDTGSVNSAGPRAMTATSEDMSDLHKGPGDRDPLVGMKVEEALRLCALYEEEVGNLYPMLNMEALMGKCQSFWSFMDSMRRVGFLQRGVEDGDSFMDDDTLILKLVLAIACILEVGPLFETGKAIFSHVSKIVNGRAVFEQPLSIRMLKIWVLMAQYQYYADNEMVAYRMIGLAARGCYELGLHRGDVMAKNYPDPEEAKWISRAFWVIYHLDRRTSCGTGMPFVIHELDIDPHLPQPDNEVPFLQLIVKYDGIFSQTWKPVSSFDQHLPKDNMGLYDYTIQQWQSSIPPSLRYQVPSGYPDDRRQQRFRLLLHLHGNSARLQLYRSVLYSIQALMDERNYGQTLIAIAKDTIKALWDLHSIVEPSRKPHSATNHFLIEALTVLFLALAQAPAEFGPLETDIYNGLTLLKFINTSSLIAKRLWLAIKGLKEYTMRLGVNPTTPMFATNDPADSNGAYGDSTGALNGGQLSAEFSKLFNVALQWPSLQRQSSMSSNGMLGHDGMPVPSYSLVGGNDREFLGILKECF